MAVKIAVIQSILIYYQFKFQAVEIVIILLTVLAIVIKFNRTTVNLNNWYFKQASLLFSYLRQFKRLHINYILKIKLWLLLLIEINIIIRKVFKLFEIDP